MQSGSRVGPIFDGHLEGDEKGISRLEVVPELAAADVDGHVTRPLGQGKTHVKRVGRAAK